MNNDITFGDLVKRIQKLEQQVAAIKSENATVTMNAGTRIVNERGEYVVLLDYGLEGMAVYEQSNDLSKAIELFHAVDYAPKALVKLARIRASEDKSPS